MKYEDTWSNNYSFPDVYTGGSLIANFEFCQKKHLAINSFVGIVNAGGKGFKEIQSGGLVPFKTRSSVVLFSIGTTARAKFLLTEKVEMFVGIGPRLDFYLGYLEMDDFFRNIDYYDGISSYLYGGIAELGFDYTKNKLQFGVNLNYCHTINQLVDFTHPFASQNQDDVWLYYGSLAFSVGYDL